MVVVMEPKVHEDKIQNVIEHLKEMGFEIHRSDGVTHTIIGAIGDIYPSPVGAPAVGYHGAGRKELVGEMESPHRLFIEGIFGG